MNGGDLGGGGRFCSPFLVWTIGSEGPARILLAVRRSFVGILHAVSQCSYDIGGTTACALRGEEGHPQKKGQELYIQQLSFYTGGYCCV